MLTETTLQVGGATRVERAVGAGENINEPLLCVAGTREVRVCVTQGVLVIGWQELLCPLLVWKDDARV